MREHIRPHVHEAKSYLHFSEYGLSPYWTLRNLVIHELDGDGEVTTEIGGVPYHITIGYSDSGIAPRPSDSIERDVLRDWELHVEGPGESKVHYQIRARYDDMRGPDGEVKSIPWPGGEGLDVLAQSSNVPLDDVPILLRQALDELATEAGTSINANYLRQPRPSSSITTVEYYVRFYRQYQQKLVRSDGAFYRLMFLLADEEGTEWVYSADNSEIVGYRHALDLDPASMSKLGPDLSRGMRLKTYHPKRVRSDESGDDPLASPKYGVAFHRSIDGESVPWSERDGLRHEIEDVLINTLEWADIPTEPDQTTYRGDDHFQVEASEVDVGRRADPTPEIEADQENVLLRILDDLTPSAKEAAKVLATDGGGGKHYQELADETDSSVSTIYRVLDQLGDAVKSDAGMVKFTSEKIRQEIIGMVERLDGLKESTADRVAELANIDLRSRADSALEKWMATYGADLVNVDGDDATLRFDTLLSEVRSLAEPRLQDVLEEGVEAWTSTGRDRLDFLEFRVEAQIRDNSDKKGCFVGSIIGW
ncbi:hypothetical protein [Halorubrum sp. F4]|uniref:DUF7845 domain-containing protein n=1 Tax=Halorubrum sp. F4 TaxID=2989715 RepID=UPI0024816C80|nr:hypothetical protein [Halorubrum sp. F4]